MLFVNYNILKFRSIQGFIGFVICFAEISDNGLSFQVLSLNRFLLTGLIIKRKCEFSRLACPRIAGLNIAADLNFAIFMSECSCHKGNDDD